MADPVHVVSPAGEVGAVPSDQADVALRPGSGYRAATPDEIATKQVQDELGSLKSKLYTLAGSAVQNDLWAMAGTHLLPGGKDVALDLADRQAANPTAAFFGELAPQVAASIASGGSSLAARVAGEAVVGAAYAMAPEAREAALRDRAIDGEKLLVSGLIGAGLGAGSEVGGAGLARLIARPGKAGLKLAAERTFGEAAPGLADEASKLLARGQSVLGGVDEGAARTFTPFTREGRERAVRATQWEARREEHVRSLVDTLEEIRAGQQAVRGEWGSVTKRPHIERLVKRDNAAQQALAAQAVLAEGDELLATLRADPLKYGGQEQVETLAAWLGRYGDTVTEVSTGRAARDAAGRLKPRTGVEGSAGARIFHVLDEMKKQVDDDVTKPLRKLGRDKASREYLRTADEIGKWRTRIAKTLEDDGLFGDAAHLQRELNSAFGDTLRDGTQGVFDRHFTLKLAPGLDPANARFVDPTKVTTMVNALTSARKDVGWQSMQNYVESVVRSSEAALKHMDLPPEKAAQLRDLAAKATAARDTIAQATDDITLANQLRSMERSEGLASALGGAGVGALLGGPVGAVLGMAGDAFLRPASMVRRVAAVTELASKFDGRMGSQLKSLGKNALKVGKTAARGARGGALAAVRAKLIAGYERDTKAVRERTAERVKADTSAALAQVASAAPSAFQAALDAADRKHRYLQGLLPKQDPTALYKPVRVPSLTEVQKWRTVTRALDDPATLLDDANDGKLSSDAVAAVRDVYPEVFSQMRFGLADQFAELVASGRTLPYAQRAHIGVLFELPTDPTITPGAIAAAQEAYAAMPPEAPPAAASGGDAPKLSDETMTASERVTREKE